MDSNRLKHKYDYYFEVIGRKKIDEMGDKFYFTYLLVNSNAYKSENELKSILIWIDNKVIESFNHFKNALNSFVDNLTFGDYNGVTSFIELKAIEPQEKTIIEQLSSKMELFSQVKKDSKIKTDYDVKINFLNWFDNSLLNDYSGKKPSELKYKEDIHVWLNTKIEDLENVKIDSSSRNTILLEKGQKSLSKVSKKESVKTLTLHDIWEEKNGKKEGYDSSISFLKRENLSLDSSFITDINGKLVWNNLTGYQHYMAGFIHICLNNKWISDSYSSTQYADILFNTFNKKPNIKWFKSIKTNPPAIKYLEPFSELILKVK